MSWAPAFEPSTRECETSPALDKILTAKPRDLGGFQVRRVLPSVSRSLVGPFIFFDHFGPTRFAPGSGMDVRPHPHINLATVTYLFEGEITHRDSLGSKQSILPGDINWMTAGRGIVHSERTGKEARARGSNLHGIQLWVALPKAQEEVEPEFRHHPGTGLPEFRHGEASLRVLAGSAYGRVSPVHTHSPLFYVDAALPPGGELSLPEEYAERAAYVVTGEVGCGTERVEAGRMLLFHPQKQALLRAQQPARLLLLGGDALDGPRHLWWNFVSSSQERIERAKRDWREGRFPKVPGDEVEFIPLPD